MMMEQYFILFSQKLFKTFDLDFYLMQPPKWDFTLTHKKYKYFVYLPCYNALYYNLVNLKPQLYHTNYSMTLHRIKSTDFSF